MTTIFFLHFAPVMTLYLISEGHSKQAAFFEFLKIIFCKIQDERNLFSPIEFYTTSSERHYPDGQASVYNRISKLFEQVKMLILRNSYGAVIDELSDDQIGNVRIPILKDVDKIKMINDDILHANHLRYEAALKEEAALNLMQKILDNEILANILQFGNLSVTK